MVFHCCIYTHIIAAPLAIRLLGRYDMWDHKDPKVLDFQYGLRGFDLDPGTDDGRCGWAVLLGEADRMREVFEAAVLNTGKIIHSYVVNNSRKIARRPSSRCFECCWWLSFI